MELISIIIGFFVGILLFYLLNKLFDVWYFGVRGIVSTFMGCWIGGFLIVFLLFYSLKYIIIGLVILAILVKIFHRKKPQNKAE